ncbi:MAG: ribonuclease III [Gammaproteobacteria bacterium]|nr:MAG: ribonuclease III [Gammaproteobacteria bacterium]
MKKSLAYTFADEHLLRQALTHRSANGPNNERLEFLGDAVLQVIVSDIVFMQKPEASEGQLSRLRSSVVRDVTLAEVALELGLGEHVFLGSGERKSGGHRRESILSDTLEAIFGAVYLDAGFDAARQVICTAYGDRLQNMPDGADLRDPKSRLQELLQGRGLALPVYAVENVTGKAHKQSFEVSCTIPELETASTGRGLTRRDAEQEAALAMLDAVDKIE